jgi:hypothetical protein
MPQMLDTRVYASSLAAAGWALGVVVADRLLLGESVDRGQPAAHSDPGDGPLEEAGPAARRARTGERPAQDRVDLLPLRVRRLERMRLHADLTMLARLASALADT